MDIKVDYHLQQKVGSFSPYVEGGVLYLPKDFVQKMRKQMSVWDLEQLLVFLWVTTPHRYSSPNTLSKFLGWVVEDFMKARQELLEILIDAGDTEINEMLSYYRTM